MQRKFNNEPSKVGRLVGARTQPIRMRARSATGKGNFAQALDVCEEAFIHNPWCVGTARDASDAAEGLGHKLLAQWLLESVQAVATDAEFFRHMAHVYETNMVWPKSDRLLGEGEEAQSQIDQDAHRKINALAKPVPRSSGSGLNEALTKKPAGSSGPDSNQARRARGDEAAAALSRTSAGRRRSRRTRRMSRPSSPVCRTPEGAKQARRRREGAGARAQGRSRRSVAPVRLRRGAAFPAPARDRLLDPARQGKARGRRVQGEARTASDDARRIRSQGIPATGCPQPGRCLASLRTGHPARQGRIHQRRDRLVSSKARSSSTYQVQVPSRPGSASRPKVRRSSPSATIMTPSRRPTPPITTS